MKLGVGRRLGVWFEVSFLSGWHENSSEYLGVSYGSVTQGTLSRIADALAKAQSTQGERRLMIENDIGRVLAVELQ